MSQIIDNHLLVGVSYFPSPNANDRPNVNDISLIVIHNISLPPKVYGGIFIEQFFLNQLPVDKHPYFETIVNTQVSAHLLIKRTGEMIQFVPFDKRAWHAGTSSYQGRDNCNDYAIGIELEGSDEQSYEQKQYQQLNKVVKLLKNHYPIIDIVGHSDIAPSRKTDPGDCFDWQQIGINR